VTNLEYGSEAQQPYQPPFVDRCYPNGPSAQ